MYSQCYVNIHGLQFVGQFTGFFSYNILLKIFAPSFFVQLVMTALLLLLTVKYSREIRKVSSTYIKEIRRVVTEHLLGSGKVLHKQLSLTFTEQIYRTSIVIQGSAHLILSCSYHIYPLMPWSRDCAWQSCLFITFLVTKTGLEL